MEARDWRMRADMHRPGCTIDYAVTRSHASRCTCNYDVYSSAGLRGPSGVRLNRIVSHKPINYNLRRYSVEKHSMHGRCTDNIPLSSMYDN